jgi:hypothetical protein
MAVSFFEECISKDIFLKIRKYIYITLNTCKSWAFFLIGFGSRKKKKARSKEVMVENRELILWEKGDLNSARWKGGK